MNYNAIKQFFVRQERVVVAHCSRTITNKKYISTLLKANKCQKYMKLTYRPYHSFSTQSSPDPLAGYSFQQLLQLKSTQSLTKAAQIMAELQIQHENLSIKIQLLQQHLLTFPQQNQFLMEKIKNIAENVKLQQQQNQDIQRRAEKQLEDAKKYAISKVAKEMLQVSDNLQRSIRHSEKLCTETHSQTKRFLKELQDVFKQFGIEEFNPVGQEFDPNTQESMMKIAMPESLSESEKQQKANKVADCFRTGYMIKGRLLRSAHVVVYE